jgi:hypothetical protein
LSASRAPQSALIDRTAVTDPKQKLPRGGNRALSHAR